MRGLIAFIHVSIWNFVMRQRFGVLTQALLWFVTSISWSVTSMSYVPEHPCFMVRNFLLWFITFDLILRAKGPSVCIAQANGLGLQDKE